jgi:hypothetical protein
VADRNQASGQSLVMSSARTVVGRLLTGCVAFKHTASETKVGRSPRIPAVNSALSKKKNQGKTTAFRGSPSGRLSSSPTEFLLGVSMKGLGEARRAHVSEAAATISFWGSPAPQPSPCERTNERTNERTKQTRGEGGAGGSRTGPLA